MDINLILSFLGASILLTLMPGPDNLFVLTESITKGQKNGILISIGLCTGVLVHTLAAATGLSIIFQQSAIAFSIIKYFGAAYLLYLAYLAYGEKPMTVDMDGEIAKESVNALALIRKGFFMNVLNPKVSLFFIAFLPQFVTNNGYHITIQMLVLGLVFMGQALIIFGLIASLSGKLTSYVNSPKFWNISKWTKVGVLVLLGIALGLTKQ